MHDWEETLDELVALAGRSDEARRLADVLRFRVLDAIEDAVDDAVYEEQMGDDL